jgi:hypothetical protein
VDSDLVVFLYANQVYYDRLIIVVVAVVVDVIVNALVMYADDVINDANAMQKIVVVNDANFAIYAFVTVAVVVVNLLNLHY